MKFTGYRPGWDKCPDCGQRLVWAKRFKSLRHKSRGVTGLTGRETHALVVRKKEEARR